MPTTLTPYLSFGGNTREAFAFYEKALGAKIETMMSYADMPPMPAGDAGCADGPPPSGDGIMHACLALPGGAMLFAGDTPPGMPYEGVKGVMLAHPVRHHRPGPWRLPRAVARRPGDDAAGALVLGQDLRHAHRPLRRELGRQWRPIVFA